MAAFGWAETYHRDARRKSVFHAAVASCDIISLASSAGHACTNAPMPAGSFVTRFTSRHWDGEGRGRRSPDQGWRMRNNPGAANLFLQ
jgi:hypothetical protein